MNETSPKKLFAPFENDHQSMQIGELIFENQTDKVIVYGDIDITKSKKGLEQALKLKQVFNDVVSALQQADAEGTLNATDNVTATKESIVSGQTQSGNEVDNPFS